MLRRLTLSASLLLLFAPAALAGSRLEFQVTFDKAVSPTPFTGRVFVLLSSANRSSDKPPLTLNWFNPEPAFAIDVKDWKPGETRVIDGRAYWSPRAVRISFPLNAAAIRRRGQMR